MLGEALSVIALSGALYAGYRRFLASKVSAYAVVEDGQSGARIRFKNEGDEPAHIMAISVTGADKLSTQTEAIAQGPHYPWVPPPVGGYELVDRLVVDIWLPPGGEVAYDFFFWSRSSRSASRIVLSIRESWLRAWRQTRTVAVPQKSVTPLQNSDIA